MTPSGSTYSLKNVGADIAKLVVGGGPGACVTQQARTCNLILGAAIRHSLMRTFVGIRPTGPNSQAGAR